MRIEIKKLHQQVQATSIFVTHDQEEAMMLSDYIAVMRDGQIVQYGPAAEIYRYPQHLYVATFIGKPRMSTMEGSLRVTADTISYDSGDLRLSWPNGGAGQAAPPGETSAVLGIRAEDVRLDAAGGTPGPGQLAGEVALLEPLGSDTFVEVMRGPITITGRVEPDRRLRVGDAVCLDLPRHKLHFFDAATGERLNV
jgi:ABC-type sugar transport system ATPase subunit